MRVQAKRACSWLFLVVALLLRRCLVQVSYSIGVPEPLSVFVDTYGTGKQSDAELLEKIKKAFDFRAGEHRMQCTAWSLMRQALYAIVHHILDIGTHHPCEHNAYAGNGCMHQGAVFPTMHAFLHGLCSKQMNSFMTKQMHSSCREWDQNLRVEVRHASNVYAHVHFLLQA